MSDKDQHFVALHMSQDDSGDHIFAEALSIDENGERDSSFARLKGKGFRNREKPESKASQAVIYAPVGAEAVQRFTALSGLLMDLYAADSLPIEYKSASDRSTADDPNIIKMNCYDMTIFALVTSGIDPAMVFDEDDIDLSDNNTKTLIDRQALWTARQSLGTAENGYNLSQDRDFTNVAVPRAFAIDLNHAGGPTKAFNAMASRPEIFSALTQDGRTADMAPQPLPQVIVDSAAKAGIAIPAILGGGP